MMTTFVRRPSHFVSALAALALLATTAADLAVAASVHLKQRSLSFTDGGLTLNAKGALTGLGNQDLLIALQAQANVTSTCTNPSGSSQPPGQNPAPISVSGSQAIPAGAVKNGNVAFNVTTQQPTTPIPGAPDCPNRQWTEAIQDLAFTSVVLSVQQGGAVVFSLSCTFSPPTADGRVPAGNISC
jgi:hypothetical protein